MVSSTASNQEEIEQLKKRIDWLEEERKKSARRAAEMEQQLVQYQRNMEAQESAIKALEEAVGGLNTRAGRGRQFGEQLTALREEMISMADKSEQRRLKTDAEQEKMRRVEQEMIQRDLAEIRKELGSFAAINQQIESLNNETKRLSRHVAETQNQHTLVEREIESLDQQIAIIAQNERTNAKDSAENLEKHIESRKRLESLEVRMDAVQHNVSRLQASAPEVHERIAELKKLVTDWSDRMQIAEHERDKRVADWETLINDHSQQMEQYARQWLTIVEQSRDARMTIDNLSSWKNQFEQQQRQNSETLRVELNRLRTLWDSFVLEHEKLWKNFQLDMDQKLSGEERRRNEAAELIDQLTGQIDEIEKDKAALWRAFNAQVDVLRRLPALLLEDVEKAKARDPDSRRQPALIPVRDE